MSYQERLDKINDTTDKTVLDCIDRPIRPLVIQLNRIGLKTRFSCCGFPYNGEEEPKTHAKAPFVVLERIIDLQQTEVDAMSVRRTCYFFILARHVEYSRWTLEPYGNGQWWLGIKDDNLGESKFYRQEEGDEPGVHDYESALIAIQSLTRKLMNIPSFGSSFTIEDGNRHYNKLTGGEWQIEPKESVTIGEPLETP